MCASCGCGKIHDNHGDDRMITMNDLEQAAEASDITVSDVVKNLEDAASQAGRQPRARCQPSKAAASPITRACIGAGARP